MGKLLFGIRLLYISDYVGIGLYYLTLSLHGFLEEYIVNIHTLEPTLIWIDLTPGTNHLFV